MQTITQIFDNAININGDVEFDTQAVANHWDGDGSSAYPYILESLDIENNSTLNLISIQNTNRYFILRKSFLIGTNMVNQVGLYLNNVQNALITNVIIKNNYNGVYVSNSNVNIQIFNNTISNNINNGIMLVSSNTIDIQDNSLSFNQANGISNSKSNHTIIKSNLIYNNSMRGINIGESRFNLIQKNDIKNNLQYGIYSNGNSPSNIIIDNKISSNSWSGIHLISNNQTIENNIAYDNKQGGIYLFSSNNSSIRNNTVYNNFIGMRNQLSNFTIIENNTVFSNSREGLWIDMSNNCNSTFNTIYNNKIGIKVNSSATLIRISENGIYLESSTYVEVKSNIFLNNNQGNKQGYDSGSNNIVEFNIWSDATGPDDNGDYILDTPYLLDGPSGTQDTSPYYLSVDLAIPFINSPIDLTIYYNVSGYSILWTVKALRPAYYSIYKNSSIYISNSPILSNGIFLSLNNFEIGIHNVTIEIIDDYGRTANDTVWINVIEIMPDITNPIIDNPNDVSIFEGSIGYTVKWTGYDDFPWSYIILDNGSISEQGDWTGNSVIYSLDGLSLGLHILNCTLIDKSGNYISDIVNVLVTVPPPDVLDPVIVEPIVDEIEIGTLYVLRWNCSDDQPYRYILTINGSVLYDDPWFGNNISYTISDLSVGVWIFNLTLIDLSGNTATSILLVTIIPEKPDLDPPSINKPIAITIAKNMTVNLVWEVSDKHPSNYILYRNESIIIQGTDWSNGIFQIEISNLAIGTWIFNLTIFDQAGNSNSSIILVNVIPLSQFDTEDPIISQVPNYNEPFHTNTQIEIYIFDQHPSKYELFINDSLVFSNSWSENNIIISYSLSFLRPGTYNFKLIAYDLVNRQASRLFLVVITGDVEPPTIDSPKDLQLKYGTNVTLTWNVFDSNPSTYEVYLMPSSLLQSGSWSNGKLTVSIGNLEIGNYTIRCIIYDEAGNNAFDDILVVVSESKSPSASSSFEFLSILSIIAIIVNRKKKIRRSN